MWAETRPHEAGFGSNRVSQARGEYVPAPCTHRPSKHPSEVRMRPGLPGRIWASQGGLSRNKVAVGESAAGSPPQTRDQDAVLAHLSVRFPTPVGHLRTIEARFTPPRRGWAHSSAVECLLCKEDALGSNPSGSMSSGSSRTVRLIWRTALRRFPTQDRCTIPRERGWEGSSTLP